MNTRRKFTPEYRQEAARLVLDTDRTSSAVAEELGVSAGLLGRWVDGSKQNANAQAKVSILQERSARMNAQELLRLRKEVAELKLDNELL